MNCKICDKEMNKILCKSRKQKQKCLICFRFAHCGEMYICNHCKTKQYYHSCPFCDIFIPIHNIKRVYKQYDCLDGNKHQDMLNIANKPMIDHIITCKNKDAARLLCMKHHAWVGFVGKQYELCREQYNAQKKLLIQDEKEAVDALLNMRGEIKQNN